MGGLPSHEAVFDRRTSVLNLTSLLESHDSFKSAPRHSICDFPRLRGFSVPCARVLRARDEHPTVPVKFAYFVEEGSKTQHLWLSQDVLLVQAP